MSLKVWVKSKAADRVLTPLRKELLALVEPGSSLFEVGCGTGDFLLQAASKISIGYGIDIDNAMIKYATKNAIEKNIGNVTFECINALEITPPKFDISTSTLCLHELDEKSACRILNVLVNNSKKVLIADYSYCKSFSGKLSIELDEIFSGHYHNFRRYRENGGLPSYVNKIDATINNVVSSTIDGISIWTISGKNM